MSKLAETIASGDLAAFDRELKGLSSNKERVAAIEGLPAGMLEKVWNLAAGKTVTIESCIPEVEKATRYRGRNSMPMFNQMSKVMWRPREGTPFGYNDQVWKAFTGPGYFVVKVLEGTVAFDYQERPSSSPSGWPAVTGNIFPIGTITFGNMIDYARWAAEGTIIGHAMRPSGKSRGVFFLMTRADA